MRTPVRLDRAIFMRLALDVETILVRKKLNDSLVQKSPPNSSGIPPIKTAEKIVNIKCN